LPVKKEKVKPDKKAKSDTEKPPESAKLTA